MSRRNFTLLIIVATAVLLVALGYLYFNQTPSGEGGESSGTNFISKFNPFGTKTTAPPKVAQPVDVSGYKIEPVVETQNVKLKKVSSMPVAGFGVFQKERLIESPPLAPPPQGGEDSKKKQPPKPLTEFIPSLRYVARATGNIYQTFADQIKEEKFSTTIIPKVYEAYFGDKGNVVIMRYLKKDDKTIETFVGNLPKETLGVDTNQNNEIRGSFLPENISDISMSPDTMNIFYLWNMGDSAIGTTYDLVSKKIQIFDSPFTEWLSQWPNTKMLTLTTKPSATVPGYMYAIDPSKKPPSKILGDINGLTTLTSPNGKLILYADNALSLNIYNTENGSTTSAGARTLPEKCVWAKAGYAIYCAVPKVIEGALYPDAWYQGEVSFTDEIWKIDPANGSEKMIAGGAETSEGIDGIKLALDEGENYLFLVNKKDSFLWELELK